MQKQKSGVAQLLKKPTQRNPRIFGKKYQT